MDKPIIGNPEQMLHRTLCFIMDRVNQRRGDPKDDEQTLFKIKSATQQVLFEYADAVQQVSSPVRWNWPKEGEAPLWTRECKDHHAVTPVGYMEVADMLGTSGCSKGEPYWIHSVMGAIRSDRGIQIVCPGDWIVTPLPGLYQVLTNEQFTKLYME